MANEKVLVFSESIQLTGELAGGAASLVDRKEVGVIVIGDAQKVQAVAHLGIATVYHIPCVDGLPLEAYASDIAELVRQTGAAVLLIGATNRGKALAAYASQVLDVSCESECKNIMLDDSKVVVERMIYGGAGISTNASTGLPVVLTIARRSFDALEGGANNAQIIECPTSASAYPLVITGLQEKSHDSVDISNATKIVCIGRGVSKQEEISDISELAVMLDAEMACTRPIAEDYHWMDRDRYVGLSGKYVKPRLYFVVGSSGVIQHIAGAQDSHTIVSIDSDEKAPVFAVSDYCINADWRAFIPALKTSLARLNS
jgi:electron transfer flavoprotein alpha subunit